METIAHFHESYKVMNGVTASVRALANEQRRRGDHPIVISGSNRNEHCRVGGVEVFYSKGFSINKFYPGGYFISRISTSRVLDICRARRVSMIHIHAESTNGFNGLYVQKILKVPCVSTFHTMWDQYTSYLVGRTFGELLKKPLNSAAWAFLKSFHSHCDATIAPSMFVKRELDKRGFRNVFFVPTGVDLRRFRPAPGTAVRATKRKFGVPEDRKVILYLGRMGFEKNLPPLFRTLEADRNAVLVFGGKGPALESTREEARRAGVEERTFFCGFVPDRDLASFYGMGDVFVMPSRSETQGLVVLEAMACGRPVVVMRGATSELVENGRNGLILDSEDGLVGAAQRVLADPELACRMGRRGREIAERHGTPQMAAHVNGVYRWAGHFFRLTQLGRYDLLASLIRMLKGYESLEETFAKAEKAYKERAD